MIWAKEERCWIQETSENLNTIRPGDEQDLSGEIRRLFDWPTFTVGRLVNSNSVRSFLKLDVGVAHTSRSIRLALHPLPDHQSHAHEQDTAQTEHWVRDSSSSSFRHLGHHFQFLDHIFRQLVDTLKLFIKQNIITTIKSRPGMSFSTYTFEPK